MRMVLVAFAAGIVLAGCGAPSDTATTSTSPTTVATTSSGQTGRSGGWGTGGVPSQPGSAPSSDDQVAAAAEKYVTDNLGGDVATSSWGRYVSGYSYSSGVLRVMLQVDRQSPDGQDIGDRAAHAVSNFIKLGSPPAELAGVNWVEATDGAGVHIAQYPS